MKAIVDSMASGLKTFLKEKSSQHKVADITRKNLEEKTIQKKIYNNAIT